MTGKIRRRGSGAVRQLPSGRWQARFLGPDGVMRPAPSTFATKIDADGWLRGQAQDVDLGLWSAPDVAAGPGVTVEQYAREWLRTRRLAPTTRAEYGRLLESRIVPTLGPLPVARLAPSTVRTWHAALGAETRSSNAKAYALLKAICATAVEDDLLVTNPCRIRGASSVRRTKTIAIATLAEVDAMVEALPDRYRAALLVAVWCGPRSGELRELRRDDVDLERGILRIRRAVSLVGGRFVVGPTKSDAGVRDVDVPPHVIPALSAHLDEHVGPAGDALLFPAGRDPGGHLKPSSLYKVFYPAREAAGRPDLRWHDLRHTGATMTAQAGATLRELMARIGHSSPATALIYQHAAAERGAEIAARLSALAGHGDPDSQPRGTPTTTDRSAP